MCSWHVYHYFLGGIRVILWIFGRQFRTQIFLGVLCVIAVFGFFLGVMYHMYYNQHNSTIACFVPSAHLCNCLLCFQVAFVYELLLSCLSRSWFRSLSTESVQAFMSTHLLMILETFLVTSSRQGTGLEQQSEVSAQTTTGHMSNAYLW